ncbi:hypothetical protein DFS34DRAFT_622161 [Phlyctochytrium arcticum]|nr:hypothetical protein DFS34DRAFT_622161 [Phlyctochytrium arcticum]
MEFMAESAVTQNELSIAGEASRSASVQLAGIGEAIRHASEDTSATAKELAGGVILPADADSPEQVMEGIARQKGAKIRRTGSPEASAGHEQLQEEVVMLRQKVTELTAELEANKTKRPLPTLAGSGRPLSHATKARGSPRNRTSVNSSASASSEVQAPSPTATSPTKDPKMDVKLELKADLKSPAASPTKAEISPETAAEEVRKKISHMGGINPLMGMNPALMAGQLKERCSRSASFDGLEKLTNASSDGISDKDVQSWVCKQVGSNAPAEGEFEDSLKDGQVLCRLINALNPSGSPIKINTGKFAFARMENINNYLKGAEALGVPKQVSFAAGDLQAGTNIPQVFSHLALLRKTVASKK